uniref:Cyclic nucleotide-binding domain-containing protein n=1 Tax=Auxenochlorella protothecoides TaxID=3075 RepID=A0A1D2AGW7_AUXPR
MFTSWNCNCTRLPFPAGNAAFTFNVVDANGWAQWVVAIYWASQTLTTVGYGDVVAVTVAEALISSVAMLLAILVFGFIVSVIGDLLTVSSLSAWRGQQIRQQLQGVEAWGKERHLGPDVMNKIRRYFIDIWAPHAGFDDAAYFYSLPVLLRGEIVSKMSGHTLQSSHLFSGLSSEVLGGLLCSAVPRRLVAGHDLYAEMSEGESFFILQEGQADAYRGKKFSRSFVGPAILGQGAIFSPYIKLCRERQQTIRACSNCILWEFKSLDLQDIIRSDPRVLVHLCKAYIQYQDMLASRLQGRHAASSLGRLYKIRAELCRLLAKAERDAAAWEEEDVQKDPDEPGVPSDGEEQIQDTDQQLQKAEDEEAPDAPPHGDAGGALPAPGSTEAAPPLPPAAQLIMQGEPHLARLSFAHPGYTEDKAAQLRRSGFGNMPGGSGRYAV